MSYQDIPEELRSLRQWLTWRYEDIGTEKPTKIPYYPRTNRYASVDDPETWSSFDEVVKAKGYDGIGFVFTDQDDFTFIDLDDTKGDKIALDRQIKIARELDSYSEISPSGTGLHVIIKGKVPAGRKRNFIEVYSSLRYATFTGNVYNNKPIANRQDEVMQLWQNMGSGPATYIFNGDAEQKEPDEKIIEQASKAANGEKFKALLIGNWQPLYPSQSEADLAFIDMLAFYTQNRSQIIRLFKSSPLGRRDKANRTDYISWMINKSFDRMLPALDFDGFKNALDTKIAEQKQLELPIVKSKTKKNQDAVKEPLKSTIPLPPGLVGEIAQFIYAASPRPAPEIALAASIGLMAGIAGRAYNVNGEGLNQYVLLIANSGSGKEAMASGIDKLINAMKLQVPTAVNIIGPAEISSGEALIKYINKNSCFVSILGEFGYRLQAWGGQHTSGSEKNLRRMLLDLYHKSGNGRVFRPKIYSDRDKNIEETISPAFSILGEATPSSFYEYLNEEMLSDGFLPRFILIEYKEKRVYLNENCANVYPPNWLIDKLSSFMAGCETLSYNKKVINIPATQEAKKLLEDFDKFTTDQINNSDKDTVHYLWNRAHLKAWKLAALIAVGINYIEPKITPENLLWAFDIVKHDVYSLTYRFETGVIGTNTIEVKQIHDMIRVIKEYLKAANWDDVQKYALNGGQEHKLFHDKVIPYSYISRRLIACSSFRHDARGATAGIKRTLQTLIESDKIREVNKQELGIKYNTMQRAFILSDMRLLD